MADSEKPKALRTWKVSTTKEGVVLTINGQAFALGAATGCSLAFDLERASGGWNGQYAGQASGSYRAAIWCDGQAELVLTLPEHAALSDADLLQEAAAEIVREGLTVDFDQVKIGEWKPTA